VLTTHLLRSGGVGALAALAVIAAAPLSAHAQGSPSPGIVLLAVHDSSGVGIADAQVTVAGTALQGETDEGGTARLANVPAGVARIDVRRLGFRPAAIRMTVAAGASVTTKITLIRAVPQLSTILVRGSAHAYPARLAGFYHRRQVGIGHFYTREEIEKQHLYKLTDLFRRIPGMQLVQTDVIQNAVRMRGESCAPLVIMDGNPLAAAEFDLDAVDPQSIDAMEVYSGLAEVPPGMMGPNGLGSCGVIAIWSRTGERRPKKSKRTVTADELTKLVASLQVYTANQVDVPAQPDTSKRVQPEYPEALFAEHVNGRVTAEFVVDTTGQVLMQTFGAISSTDPAFTEAVRRVLSDAVFTPASRDGRLVRQVVYQPFTFIADSSATQHSQQDDDARTY